MSICRGCPHYHWEIRVDYDGASPVRFIDTCGRGLAAAGWRTSCAAKPSRDTGQRRRVTDLGQSGMEPDHGADTETASIRR